MSESAFDKPRDQVETQERAEGANPGMDTMAMNTPPLPHIEDIADKILGQDCWVLIPTTAMVPSWTIGANWVNADQTIVYAVSVKYAQADPPYGGGPCMADIQHAQVQNGRLLWAVREGNAVNYQLATNSRNLALAQGPAAAITNATWLRTFIEMNYAQLKARPELRGACDHAIATAIALRLWAVTSNHLARNYKVVACLDNMGPETAGVSGVVVPDIVTQIVKGSVRSTTFAVANIVGMAWISEYMITSHVASTTIQTITGTPRNITTPDILAVGHGVSCLNPMTMYMDWGYGDVVTVFDSRFGMPRTVPPNGFRSILPGKWQMARDIARLRSILKKEIWSFAIPGMKTMATLVHAIRAVDQRPYLYHLWGEQFTGLQTSSGWGHPSCWNGKRPYGPVPAWFEYDLRDLAAAYIGTQTPLMGGTDTNITSAVRRKASNSKIDPKRWQAMKFRIVALLDTQWTPEDANKIIEEFGDIQPLCMPMSILGQSFMTRNENNRSVAKAWVRALSRYPSKWDTIPDSGYINLDRFTYLAPKNQDEDARRTINNMVQLAPHILYNIPQWSNSNSPTPPDRAAASGPLGVNTQN